MHDLANKGDWSDNYSQYEQLQAIQESLLRFIYDNSFLFQSGVETLYLVVCVIWGNLGWDRIKNIKSDPDDSKFVEYFVSESATGLGFFGFLSATAMILTMVMSGTWWYGIGKMEVFWTGVFSLCFTLLFQIHRAYKHTKQ
ncbi:hypothetical protein [Marinobacter sp. F4206]|uniref:hypothetical protein n=1 Tax=Marinobacter sp. F4206 TaxID=2861777 RepID=UPI001C5EB131|nr:hypothetical protein [Marinobacter sp. F4206]MBW4935566.1 hypothetical protein [Marinobacter sp. F4206]